jgi:hypothetical protein
MLKVFVNRNCDFLNSYFLNDEHILIHYIHESKFIQKANQYLEFRSLLIKKF